MNVWIAQHFFNAAFVAGGAALVGLPIAIHFINRLRYRRVRFAAMEFLLQSEQRNRRRLLLEQMLLLLLRVLLVLGLVALIARLILDPDQLSIFRGAKAHHVVLLDDSGSMQDRWGETSAFREALEAVRKLASGGAQRPDTQKLTLMLLSSPQVPLFVERDVNEAFVTEMETKLENLHPTHRSLNLIKGLDAARTIFADQKATIKHLHVISDFRERDWSDRKAVGTAIAELDEQGVTVNLVRTVPEPHANLAVTSLSGALNAAAAGVPIRMSVTVSNFGELEAKDASLSVIADGQKLPMNLVFDKIPAGEEVTRDFDVMFVDAQKHSLRVELPPDSLPADNSRYLVVDVAPSHSVLIVDGAPAADEAQFIADALAANPAITGLAPLVEGPDYLASRPLSPFQSIFLLNVPELPSTAIEALEEYVRSGGGLVWFMGETVRTAFYNDRLYNQGNGLFPVTLSSAPRELSPDTATNPGPDLKFNRHPLFRIFEGEDNPFVESVHVARYFPVSDNWNRNDQARNDGVETIASLRNGEPFAFEHRLGAGRIITFLSSAGPSWNNWALNPSYVIIQLEAHKRIARQDAGTNERIVGSPIQLDLDPTLYTDAVEITVPDTAGSQLIRLRAAPETPSPSAEAPSGSRTVAASGVQPDLHATFSNTDDPGIYTVRLVDRNQLTEERWIPYNVPIDESELELASNDTILGAVGDSAGVRIQEAGQFQWIEGKNAGQEIRLILVFGLLLLLLCEQILAYRLSFHPKALAAA